MLKIWHMIVSGNAAGEYHRVARRAGLATAAVAIVLLLTSRCDFSAVLLNQNSPASLEDERQKRAGGEEVWHRAYAGAHKSDVRTGIVVFGDGVCAQFGDFHDIVSTASRDEAPRPIDVAVTETVTALQALVGAGRAVHRADLLVAPAVAPILDRNTDSQVWVRPRCELAAVFRAATADD